MRTRALLFASLFLSTPAAAEWLLTDRDDLSKVYMEPASRQRLPDKSVRVRALTDYEPRSPQAASFRLSEKGRSEIEEAVFDCAKSLYRSNGGSWFDGSMATGAVRSDYPAKESWSEVPPFYAGLFAKACAGP